MEAIAKAGEGCRVVAVDRPPFGLSERPLSWPEGPGNNPYSNAVSGCTSAPAVSHLCSG